MADALSKINFSPSCRHSHRYPRCHHIQHVSLPPPSIDHLKSVTSSYNLNGRRLFANSLPFSSGDHYGRRIEGPSRNSVSPARSSTISHSGLRFPRTQKWWEKGLQPNMKEVIGANDLVDSLLNAGEKLVVVDFFSPGCGGCKALHPKICQLAEMNPNVQFLQVNYEEHKSMCYSLGVHVLPFFRFYRGADGRLCSFSCTNATIKKFKDALAKHNTDRCSLGPNKGLEEKELLALAANKELGFNYTPEPAEHVPAPVEEVKLSESERWHPDLEPLPLPLPLPLPFPSTLRSAQPDSEENAFVR